MFKYLEKIRKKQHLRFQKKLENKKWGKNQLKMKVVKPQKSENRRKISRTFIRFSKV